MLYSHASKSFRRIISFFLNVLVITSMVLGSFSTVIAQDGSDGTTADASPAAGTLGGAAAADVAGGDLAIRQGGSARYRATAGQTLRFDLDVAYPLEGAAYTWTLLNPPGNGEAVLNPQGANVTVAYTASAGFSGMDLFAVQVSDGNGQAARIGVMVEVSPRAGYAGARHPVNSAQWLPGVTPSRAVSEMSASELRVPGRELPDYSFTPSANIEPLEISTEDFRPDEDWGIIGSPISSRKNVRDFLPLPVEPPVDDLESKDIPDPLFLPDGAFVEEIVTPDVTAPLPLPVGEVGISEGTPYIIVENLCLIHVSGWPVGVPITLTIDNPVNGVGVDYTDSIISDAYFTQFLVTSYTLAAGYIVTVSDGTTTKSHTIRNLSVLSVDLSADTVGGTADPGSEVFVWAYPPPDSTSTGGSRSVVTGPDGHWLADFSVDSEVVDIVAGFYGGVTQYDEDGDSSFERWDIMIPHFSAKIDSNTVHAHTWLLGYKTFTLTIDDPTNGSGVDYSDTFSISAEPVYNHYASFGFTLDNFDLQAGQIITMTDGETTKTHIVTSLVLSEVNTASDTVSGTAESGSEVSVYACNDQTCDYTSETTNSGGDWIADFSDVSHAVDLAAGSDGRVDQSDDDYDSTSYDWFVADPIIRVYPLYDYVVGYEWPAYAVITLTVDDPGNGTGVDYNAELNADETGYAGIWIDGFDILPGQVVVMTDGFYTRTHTVTNLAVTAVNETPDTVSGTADPGGVTIFARNDIDTEYLYPTADSSGNWTTTFSSVHLTPGTWGQVIQYDGEANSTWVYWEVPTPVFDVYLEDDRVEGWAWRPSTQVSVNVAGHVYSPWTDGDGNFDTGKINYDIQSGDLVAIDDGNTQKDHYVYPLSITDINLTEDTLAGTAEQDRELGAWACGNNDCGSLITTSAGTGAWSVDFTDIANDIDIDIDKGSDGEVWQADDEDDRTVVFWRVPDPRFTVNLSHYYVWGGDWTPGSTATLNVRGEDVATTTVEPNGELSFGTSSFNIIPGDTVTLRDPYSEKSLLVRNLTVDNVDLATEIVNGTADTGSVISVWGNNVSCPEGVDASLETTAVDGEWMVDFSSKSCDIHAGSEVFVNLNEEDGDYTEVRWNVPNTAFALDPENSTVWGWEWPIGVEITIEILTKGIFYANVDDNGNFGTDALSVDIVTGDVVLVSGGGLEKAHTVRELREISYSEIDDTINGFATEGKWVNVWGCDKDNCDGIDWLAGTGGAFSVDMTEIGIDIAPGTEGNVGRWDSDGDGTVINWRVPNPRFSVSLNQDYVRCVEWTPETQVDLYINDVLQASETSDESGFVMFNGQDIQPNWKVTVTDGTTTKVLDPVSDMTLTEVNEIADTVSGTAPIGSLVEVSVYSDNSYSNTIEIEAAIDGSGNWVADFGAVGWDITGGNFGYAIIRDDDRDSTALHWEFLQPTFDVDPQSDGVWGSQWPANSTVTLTIGTNVYTSESNGDGWVDFGQLQRDLVAGDTLTLSAGEYSKTHTILDFAVTGFDEGLDQVYGMAPAGANVGAWGCDENHCEGNGSTAIEGDTWMVDLSGIWDIQPGAQGGAHVTDEDGDGTHSGWRVPDPIFSVNLNQDYVYMNNWASNATLTITVDDVEMGTVEADWGGWAMYENIDIQPGSHVVISGGGDTKELLSVTDLTLEGFSKADDTVFGTAPAGTLLQVWAHESDCVDPENDFVSATADSNDEWVADFTGTCDIKPGSNGFAQVYDDDGDYSEVHWRVPYPVFRVNPVEEHMWGHEFLADTTLTITIDGVAGSFNAQTDGGGNFDLGLWGEVDLAAGSVVHVTDGESTKHLTLTSLVVDGIDEGEDIVNGSAEPGSWLTVRASDRDSEFYIDLQAHAVTGAWSYDFSDDGVDIGPGSEVYAIQWDDDGDCTHPGWRIPNPSFGVNPEDNTVWGWEWPADTAITLTINDGDPINTVTNENGDFGFDPLEVDIVTGDEVLVSGGGTNKTHTVLELHDISYSELDDTVSGYATEDEWVNVWACDDDSCDGIDWQAGPGGAFSAEMWRIGIDIAPRTDGNVGRWDENGDGTVIFWRVPNPNFSVNPENNNVWGDEWLGNTDVTLTIGTFTRTVTSQGDGHVEFGEIPLDLGVGDHLVISDGENEKDHTILPFTITGVDEDTDVVTGTAPDNTWVDAWACDNNHCEGNGVESEADGSWEVDLSDRWDIVKGTWGSARAVDNDGDGTQLDWYIPNPMIYVYPFENKVRGWDLTPGATANLTIGTYHDSATVDDNWYVEFYTANDPTPFDILPGQTVVVADGTNTRSAIVTNIAVTGFDEGLEQVYGTAAPNSAVLVVAYDEYDYGWGEWFTVDATGNWTADFNTIEDIKEGTWGWLAQIDTDGDYIIIQWEVLPDAPANDLLAEAENLILPVSPININTSSATTSATDPALGTCLNWRYSLADKGQASVWYKYVATQDGALVIDTRGSDYDTALAVYSGMPSAATRIACNDDLSDYDMDSSLIATVRTGSTYYIEVVDTGFTQWKPEAGIQSMEVDVQEIPQTQAVGGELTLNVELKNCYTLTATASPATGGTVTRTPAPNCAGTKYAGGTKITLSALPKTTTNFLKWIKGSEEFTDNIHTFPITEDTIVEARFVGIPGAVTLSSPASGALLHLEDVYPKTPITLKWLATSIPSVEYDWQVAQNNLFTDDLHAYVTTELQLQPDWLEADKTYYWKVRGINAAGGKGAWSAVRNFRVAVLKPDGLDVIDASVTNRPTFTWNAVDGASGYYVQIARNATFTSIVTSGTLTGGANTAFTPALNLATTALYPQLYWRVRANSSTRGPGLYNEGDPFTVPAAVPAIPLLTSPLNNALTTVYNPLFNWSDVAGATGYEWQIAYDAAFTNIYPVGNTVIASESYPAHNLFPDQVYYWRVRTVKDGIKSGWSAVRSLRTAVEPPWLYAPGNEEVLNNLRPTFDWSDVTGNNGYTLQIASKITLPIVVVGTYSTPKDVSQYTPTANLPANKILYWRVQTKSTVRGPSAWSSDWFSMDMPNPPSVPLLVAPAANALVLPEAETKFDWGNSTVPTGTTFDHYQVAIFTDAKCTENNWIRNENSGDAVVEGDPGDVTHSFFPFDGLPPKSTFYWAARAYNTDGEYSAWSACRVFRTAVEAPMLLEPVSGETQKTNRPTFKWQPVVGATSYTIQVSRNATFTSIVTSGTATGPSWSPSVNLPMPTSLYPNLYWRVRANSTSNGPGAWSNQYPLPSSYWSFVPGAPLPIPTLLTPLHGALSTTTIPTFSWSYAVPATKTLQGYKIQIAFDSAFTDVIVEEVLNGSTYPPYTPPGSGLEPGKTYYWRVAASFMDGDYTGWTTARTLRIALPPPELISPEDGENPLHLRPTLDWEEVTGATGYTVQVARNNTFTSLVGSYSRTALQTDYTPTSNLPANIPLFWRVQTKSTTYGPSAWSEWRMLDMPNPPGIPSLVSPASGATLTTRNPRLDWSNVTLPAGENWGRYEVQVATDSAFTDVVREEAVDGLISNSEYTVEDGLLSGTYYWRVRAFNGVDPAEYSAWSAVRSFKVSAAVLRVGTTTVFSTLDPVDVNNYDEIVFLKSIYEGLTALDENLETVPGAAESWVYNDDATELTFTLWPGLRYSDGSPLNAKRFEYAINRYLAAGPDAVYSFLLGTITRVEARDPYGDLCSSYTQTNCLTLWIQFTEPSSYAHSLMNMAFTYPVKAEKIAAGGANWWAVPANQVGNGPFKMSSFDADGRSVLLPNTYHRGGAPTYRMEYNYYPDTTMWFNAYRADELDMMPVNLDQVDEILNDPAFDGQMLTFNGPRTFAAMFNVEKEPFNDEKVRQAFALALDREELVTDVYNNHMRETLTWIPPGFPGHDSATTQWAYDPGAADAALAQSSYSLAGQPIPEVTVYYIDSGYNRLLWEELEQQWEEELGVTIHLESVDGDTFREKRDSDVPEDQLQAFSYGWTADYADPHDWLDMPWGEGGVFNTWTHYDSAAFTDLLAQANAEQNPALRMLLYQDAQRQLMLDLPMIPVYSTANRFLAKPWVQGVLPAAMDSTWAGEQVPLAVSVQ